MNDALRLPSVMKGTATIGIVALFESCMRSHRPPIVHQHTPQILPIVLQCLSQRVSTGKNVVACALGVLEGALRLMKRHHARVSACLWVCCRMFLPVL